MPNEQIRRSRKSHRALSRAASRRHPVYVDWSTWVQAATHRHRAVSAGVELASRRAASTNPTSSAAPRERPQVSGRNRHRGTGNYRHRLRPGTLRRWSRQRGRTRGADERASSPPRRSTRRHRSRRKTRPVGPGNPTARRTVGIPRTCQGGRG